MAATTGRVVAVGAVVVAAVVALLAGGADADCFDYCFKDCMARENNMVDYCSYACDKTCQPDKPMVSSRPLVTAAVAAAGRLVGDMKCQLSCALDSCHRLRPDGKGAVEACFGQCYDGCKTTAAMLPRPLRAGAGVHAVAWPARSPEAVVLAPHDDPDHHVFSSPPDDVDHDPDQVFATPPDDIDDAFAARPGDPDHQVFAAPPGDPDHA